MKLEQQVTSLEPSKKLKELGVKQESYFYHCPWSSQELLTCKELGEEYIRELSTNGNESTYSAFTVADLGEMLPAKVNGFYIRYEKMVTEHGFYRWSVTYHEIGREDEQRLEGRYSDIGMPIP